MRAGGTLQFLSNRSQVFDKTVIRRAAFFRVGRAQDRRWVYGRSYIRSYILCHGMRNEAAAVSQHAVLPADQGACGRSPQANDDLRLHTFQLGVQPRAARDNFDFRRLFVNPAFSALFEFEVLDYISDIDVRAFDSGVG